MESVSAIAIDFPHGAIKSIQAIFINFPTLALEMAPVSNQKPFAPSAERNRHDILRALEPHLAPGETVLEIGSGTGQHLSWFAEQCPDVNWHPSDLTDKQDGIRTWVEESATTSANLFPPVILDVEAGAWPFDTIDLCYTANTLHIMPWKAVVSLFGGAAGVLRTGGKLCVYGPFKINGKHISEGNARFDAHLKSTDTQRGIRDLTLLDLLAREHGLFDGQRISMPSNNFLLIWKKADR